VSSHIGIPGGSVRFGDFCVCSVFHVWLSHLFINGFSKAV